MKIKITNKSTVDNIYGKMNPNDKTCGKYEFVFEVRGKRRHFTFIDIPNNFKESPPSEELLLSYLAIQYTDSHFTAELNEECYPDIPKNLAEKFLEIAKEDAKKIKEILSEEEILFLMSK